MTITPLEARAPQMDAAAASLNIDMLSTSLGLIELNLPSIGKPSTTNNGSLLLIKLPCPRMTNEMSPSAF